MKLQFRGVEFSELTVDEIIGLKAEVDTLLGLDTFEAQCRAAADAWLFDQKVKTDIYEAQINAMRQRAICALEYYKKYYESVMCKHANDIAEFYRSCRHCNAVFIGECDLCHECFQRERIKNASPDDLTDPGLMGNWQ